VCVLAYRLGQPVVCPRAGEGNFLAKARKWDTADLFDSFDGKDFDKRQRMSAVSGAASAVARYWPDDAWTEELGIWCLDIFERADSCPEGEGAPISAWQPL
jgi:hypothetical protein